MDPNGFELAECSGSGAPGKGTRRAVQATRLRPRQQLKRTSVAFCSAGSLNCLWFNTENPLVGNKVKVLTSKQNAPKELLGCFSDCAKESERGLTEPCQTPKVKFEQ